jgi:mRNA-degrading endonuclease toxin of MazEF toxin-antitoxin module
MVVQADVLNGRIADTVLALVSRTLRAVGATEVMLDPAVETGCGLRYPSVVPCNNLLTIDQGLVVQILGRLSVTAMRQVDDRLKAALHLP